MKRNNLQKGSHHVVIVLAAVVALVGVLGFVGYNSYKKQTSNAATASTIGQAQPSATAKPAAAYYTYPSSNVCYSASAKKVYARYAPKGAYTTEFSSNGKKLADNDKAISDVGRVTYEKGYTEYYSVLTSGNLKDTVSVAFSGKYLVKNAALSTLKSCGNVSIPAAATYYYGTRGLCRKTSTDQLFIHYENAGKYTVSGAFNGKALSQSAVKYAGSVQAFKYYAMSTAGKKASDTVQVLVTKNGKKDYVAFKAKLSSVRNCLTN